MGKVLSINISKQRGVEKIPVKQVNVIKGWGLEGDGHGGDWDKQVSVLPIEALAKVPKEMIEEVASGGYTENFTISGIELDNMSIGTILKIGEAEIVICHIGKEKFKEHNRHYIVSREGRFGRVIKSGIVKVGDLVDIIK
ncbi:MOSC domain-containing protein [Proteiniborus sp.]|uniref:MOSC domain-containing protein n=1 Tax=Proteiniborus sp. TaxID=2079015 RepID=UPI003320D3EA